MNLPKGWQSKHLDELTEKISDGIHSTPNYCPESKYFFVNGNNIKNGQVKITKDTKCVPEEEWLKHKKDLGSSTILLSINGTIGNLAFYKNEPVVLGKSAAYINLASDISKKFIYYFLASHRARSYFESELTGSTIRNLSLGAIRKLSVPLPPLPEQKKIAEILSCWDKAIKTTAKLIEAKVRLKKGIKQRLFASVTEFMIPLGRVLLSSQYGLSCASSSEGETPILRMLNLDGGGIDVSDLVYVTLSADELKKFKLNKGDVLFNRTNSQNLVGKTALFALDGEYVCASYIVRLQVDRERILPDYLNYFLNFEPTQHRLKSLATKGVSQSNINPTNLKKYLEVPAPPLDVQEKQLGLLISVDRELGMLRALKQIFHAQKKGLMQKLLTGQIRVKV